MWEIKTEDEIKSQIRIRRKNLNYPILISLLTFIFSSIHFKLGCERWKMTSYPISWSDFFIKIPGLLIISVLVGVGVFIYQYFFKNYRKSEDYICTKCGCTSKSDLKDCACGNKFIPIEFVSWIKEKDKKKAAKKHKKRFRNI